MDDDNIKELQTELCHAELNKRLADAKVQVAKEALAEAYRASFPTVFYCHDILYCWSTMKAAKLQLAKIPSLTVFVAQEISSRLLPDNVLCKKKKKME